MATAPPPGFVLDAAPPAPAQPPGLPEGFMLDDGSMYGGPITQTAPKASFSTPKPAKTPEELKFALSEMTKRRLPVEDLVSYAREAGYSFDQDTQDWLRGAYTDNLLDPTYDDGTPIDSQISDWDIEGPPPEQGVTESVLRGVQGGALRGWADEIAGFSGAVGNKLGTAFGMNESDADFWDIYQQIAEQQRREADAAWEQHPGAYAAGFVPGMFTGPSFMAAGKAGAPLTGWSRAGRAASIGATEGGVSAAGAADPGADENFMNRLPDAAWGTAAGAALGPVVDRAAGFVGREGRRAWERFGPASRSPDSGLLAMSNRVETDPAAMRAEAELMQQGGVEPRLADVVPDEGRSLIRQAAQMQTPARAEVAQHAESVYADLPERVAGQARKGITGEKQTARQIAAVAEKERDAAISRAIDPIRQEPVPVTMPMMEAFGTRAGRKALRDAAEMVTPEGRAAIAGVNGALNAIAKLDPRLPAPAREKITAQIIDELQIPLDVADKFAVAARDVGRLPGMKRASNAAGKTVRDEARQLHPAYNQALEEYSAASRVMDAATGARGSRFEGTDFLKTPPDDFVTGVRQAGDVPLADPPLSEADALAVRARDEVVDASLKGRGQGALPVARQVASGPHQQARNATLLGGRKAQNLERGMGAEVKRYETTKAIDPRAGSQPMTRGKDAIVDGFAEAARDVATGGRWPVIRVLAKWLAQGGIRNVDAERLSRDAIDPTRVEAAISYLEQRGMARGRAQRLTTTLGSILGGRATTNDEKEPVNSIRALMKNQGVEQ